MTKPDKPLCFGQDKNNQQHVKVTILTTWWSACVKIYLFIYFIALLKHSILCWCGMLKF